MEELFGLMFVGGCFFVFVAWIISLVIGVKGVIVISVIALCIVSVWKFFSFYRKRDEFAEASYDNQLKEELKQIDARLKSKLEQARDDAWAEILGFDDKVLADQLACCPTIGMGNLESESSDKIRSTVGSSEDKCDQCQTIGAEDKTELRGRPWRLLMVCLAIVVSIAAVALLVPSKEKTARRLFNQYQAEMNASYGKNDVDELKMSYGSMLKDAEKEQVSRENFRQGLKSSWYDKLLPETFGGVQPGSLRDFDYYGRIYEYLSRSMTFPEAKGLVEECWRESGQEKKTECRINGKNYVITSESVVFSKEKKVLTGEIGEMLAGVKTLVRYDGEDAQVVQIIGARDASLAVRKEEEHGKMRFSAVNINTLLRQADAEVKNGNLESALSLYENVKGLVPERAGLAKKIDTVKGVLRTQEAVTPIISQADANMEAGRLQEALAGYKEAQALNVEQAGLKEKIARAQEMIRAEAVLVKADEDMAARRYNEALTGYREVQELSSKQAGLNEKMAAVTEKIQHAEVTSVLELKAKAREERKPLFRDNGDGTVSDLITGLMWGRPDSVHARPNWTEAREYCQNYKGGGFTDWRMPTSSELAALCDQKEGCGPGIGKGIGDQFKWGSESRASEAPVVKLYAPIKEVKWHSKSGPVFVGVLPVRGKAWEK